jgi:hypothetical protein
MEIYQLHHISIAEIAAQSSKEPQKIAEEILKGEETRGKHPLNKNKYVLEITKSIDSIRSGVELLTLGIDFPHTGLETDPICRSCRQCPTMKDREDVEEFYKIRIKR